MSFWSKLGKIALTVAPIAAAPFTGGASLAASGVGMGAKIAKAAAAAAPILGGLAAGRAQGKGQEAGINANTDVLNQNRVQQNNQALLDAFKAKMDASKFNTDANSQYASQAVRGDLMANMQDVTSSHPRADIVHFGGGLRPSALGPNARAAGAALSSAGRAGMNSNPAGSVPNLSMAPDVTPAPTSGILDKILSVAGPATALAGAFSGGNQAQSQVPSQIDPLNPLKGKRGTPWLPMPPLGSRFTGFTNPTTIDQSWG